MAAQDIPDPRLMADLILTPGLSFAISPQSARDVPNDRGHARGFGLKIDNPHMVNKRVSGARCLHAFIDDPVPLQAGIDRPSGSSRYIGHMDIGRRCKPRMQNVLSGIDRNRYLPVGRCHLPAVAIVGRATGNITIGHFGGGAIAIAAKARPCLGWKTPQKSKAERGQGQRCGFRRAASDSLPALGTAICNHDHITSARPRRSINSVPLWDSPSQKRLHKTLLLQL